MNNVLSIKSANISIDRGTYTCIAKSDMGYSPSNMTFYVRIKSKLNFSFNALFKSFNLFTTIVSQTKYRIIKKKKLLFVKTRWFNK